MPQKHLREISIRFSQGDPAEILFFAEWPKICHDEFEAFITQSLKMPWQNWFKPETWYCPIRHLECEFFRPLLPGSSYRIEVFIGELKESSFTSCYRIKSLEMGQEITHASCKIVHTFVDQKEFKKMPIPDEIRSKLSLYLQIK